MLLLLEGNVISRSRTSTTKIHVDSSSFRVIERGIKLHIRIRHARDYIIRIPLIHIVFISLVIGI